MYWFSVQKKDTHCLTRLECTHTQTHSKAKQVQPLRADKKIPFCFNLCLNVLYVSVTKALFSFSDWEEDEPPKPPLRFKTGSRLSARHRELPVAPLRANWGDSTEDKEEKKVRILVIQWGWMSLLHENLVTSADTVVVIFRFDTNNW